MQHFKYYTKEDILSLVRLRKFETKLGERIKSLPKGMEMKLELEKMEATYVIIGIPEDIGVRANLGKGGADTAWLPFLSSFLNTQSNDFLDGENIVLLGHFDFGDIKYLIENHAGNAEEKLEAYRHAVNTMDAEIENIINMVATAGKVPIVIGGGHNNAYPIIKGVAKGLHKLERIPLAQIHCINMDAQSDYRPMEGRHSGNAFRYAEADGYLGKYFMIGLHENYLPQGVLTDLKENPFTKFISFEDIYIRENLNFQQVLFQALEFTADNVTGIELDLDSIQDTLSSAYTPSGFLPTEARQYIHQIASKASVAYLHISEGACRLADGVKDETTGKLISYLVGDFIKAHV